MDSSQTTPSSPGYPCEQRATSRMPMGPKRKAEWNEFRTENKKRKDAEALEEKRKQEAALEEKRKQEAAQIPRRLLNCFFQHPHHTFLGW